MGSQSVVFPSCHAPKPISLRSGSSFTTSDCTFAIASAVSAAVAGELWLRRRADLPDRFVPVGRLDADTTGLLLWTDDGQLAQSLMRPGAAVWKTYEVELDWPGMFRDALTFALPACTVELSLGSAYQTTLRGCRIENADLALAGDMVIVANGGRPAVDLNAVVSRGRVDRRG